jgi:hypothetical protein
MFPLCASLSFRKEKLHCSRCGNDGGCETAVIPVLDEFMQKKKKLGSAVVNKRPVSCVCIIASHLSIDTAELMSKNIGSQFLFLGHIM